MGRRKQKSQSRADIVSQFIKQTNEQIPNLETKGRYTYETRLPTFQQTDPPDGLVQRLKMSYTQPEPDSNGVCHLIPIGQLQGGQLIL